MNHNKGKNNYFRKVTSIWGTKGYKEDYVTFFGEQKAAHVADNHLSADQKLQD